jgi:formylglycine-generating enzyme required for sulfatase activity
MIKSFTKASTVIVSSTILTTLAVNAVDMNGYFSHTMLGGLFFGVEEKIERVCPNNMTLVTQALVPFCIDVYEASPSETCPYHDPKNEGETMLNFTNTECVAVSKPNSMPWRNITLDQAQQACSRSGKRLPTTGEWYKASLGTPDSNDGWNEEHCNVANNRSDGVSVTGSGMRCISDAGVYDMIGNVWEWVHATVTNGNFGERALPTTGFVTGVDVDGLAYETNSAKESMFNNDRFWIDSTIVAGIMRGGYYNSQSQAGIYSAYIASPPTFSGEAVGFRCVVSIMQ